MHPRPTARLPKQPYEQGDQRSSCGPGTGSRPRLSGHGNTRQAAEMGDDLVEGIERATFGTVPRATVDTWLREHLRARLGVGIEEVLFRSGRVNAVYGLLLDDGARVVTKVHRPALGEARTASLAAAVHAQHLLAAAGYPCPTPLDGPAATADLTATVESWLDAGVPGDAHDPGTRTAIATSLAHQVQLLTALPATVAAALQHPPAWAVYQRGPWPVPHDPIFDFTSTPEQYTWLDGVAAEAAAVLNDLAAEMRADAVGHSDWYCGNLRFSTPHESPTSPASSIQVAAAWDWDSLVRESEAVIAGMAAASYTDSSTSGPQSPAPDEAAAFLADYDASRGEPFTAAEQAGASAMVTWTLAYNARCLIDVQRLGYDLPEGHALDALAGGAPEYMRLRW